MASKRSPTNRAVESPRIDDLKLINGIGPAVEKRLNGVGIFTFTQLAALSPADVAAAVANLAGLSAERIVKQDWIGQARRLASVESVTREAQMDIEASTESAIIVASPPVTPPPSELRQVHELITEPTSSETQEESEAGVVAEEISTSVAAVEPLASIEDASIPSVELEQDTVLSTEHYHPATFKVEFLLDEDNNVQSTHVMHVQSEQERGWMGWQKTQLVDFLRECAGLNVLSDELDLPNAEEPVATEEVPIPRELTVEESVIVGEPVVTEEPVMAEESVMVEEVVANEKLIGEEEPVAVEELVAIEEAPIPVEPVVEGSVIVGESVVTEEPVMAEESVMVEEVVANEKLIGEEEPVAVEELVAIEEAPIPEEPAVEESVIVGEPVVTEEPVMAEESVMVEEVVADEKLIGEEEPVATEEPVVAEEPVASEEPIHTSAVVPEGKPLAPLAEQVGLAGNLRVSKMEVIGVQSSGIRGPLTSDKPFNVRLTLDLTEFQVPGSTVLNYKASVYGKERISHSGLVVGEAQGSIVLADTVTVSVECPPLPDGFYRLVAAVIVGLPGTELNVRPGTTAVMGDTIWVY